MKRYLFIFIICASSFHWLIANNSQLKNPHQMDCSLNTVNPWLAVSLPLAKVKLKNKPSFTISSIPTQQSHSFLANVYPYTQGMVYKVRQDSETQLYTVYVIHRHSNQAFSTTYSCSIYPLIQKLTVSLNQIVTKGDGLGYVKSSKNWKPQLINLNTFEPYDINVANISKKVPTSHALSLNTAMQTLKQRVQQRKFNELPGLQIIKP